MTYEEALEKSKRIIRDVDWDDIDDEWYSLSKDWELNLWTNETFNDDTDEWERTLLGAIYECIDGEIDTDTYKELDIEDILFGTISCEVPPSFFD
jgi:hypothetical protein